MKHLWFYFFNNTKHKSCQCGAVLNDLGHLATPEIAGKSILFMAPTLGWPPFLSWCESYVSASLKYVAMIIVVLMASTLIFSMMLPTGGHCASSRITQAEMIDIDQFCREANAMAKHDEFLRNAVPIFSRVGNHSHSCCSAQGTNCSCNGGTYTFSDVDDLEAQLLKPGDAHCVRNIQKVILETSIGLENFRRVCHTPNASEALDAAFSVGATTPGQSQGTGNLFWGEDGRFTRTFKYWRSVLTASLNLIPRLIGTILSLFKQLCASEAREAAAEARVVAAQRLRRGLQRLRRP
jgi:hypothetical protein